MMALIFGSKEANDWLERDTGFRFDVHWPDPFQVVERDIDDSDRYCDICGGYMDFVDCWNCGGKGGRDGDDLMAEDPMWYDEDDWEDCDVCRGKGGYWECASLPHDGDAGA